MKKPNKAVLDGDILAWKTAFVVDAEGDLAIDSLLGSLIKSWTPKGVKDVLIAISHKENFRKELFPSYKSNRAEVVKPDSLGNVFECLQNNYKSMSLPKLEADDILGIYASSGKAISVSIDKDLKGVPGWLYNPDKDKKPYYISEDEAERWFCTQWMAGDNTDGIPGMWRIGKKKAEKFLNEWDPDDWYNNIQEMYSEEKYAPREEYDIENPCIAMGQCVRILRHDNYDMKKEEIKKVWSPIVGL